MFHCSGCPAQRWVALRRVFTADWFRESDCHVWMQILLITWAGITCHHAEASCNSFNRSLHHWHTGRAGRWKKITRKDVSFCIHGNFITVNILCFPGFVSQWWFILTGIVRSSCSDKDNWVAQWLNLDKLGMEYKSSWAMVFPEKLLESVCFLLIILYFWHVFDRVSCIPHWPWNCYVAVGDLNF